MEWVLFSDSEPPSSGYYYWKLGSGIGGYNRFDKDERKSYEYLQDKYKLAGWVNLPEYMYQENCGLDDFYWLFDAYSDKSPSERATAWQKYVDLEIVMKQEKDPEKKEQLITEWLKIGSEWDFGLVLDEIYVKGEKAFASEVLNQHMELLPYSSNMRELAKKHAKITLETAYRCSDAKIILKVINELETL